MALLATLPPPLVERADHQRRHEAACKIQSYFRGYMARSRLSWHREQAVRDKAARVLQRHIRRYLSCKECSEAERFRVPQTTEESISEKHPSLSLEEVRKRHRIWCETHATSIHTREELEELHRRVQISLQTRRLRRQQQVIQDEVIRANLARIKLDAELLLSEPSDADTLLVDEPSEARLERAKARSENRIPTNITTLARAVDCHCPGPRGKPTLDDFMCRTQPLAARAKQEHRDCLLSLRKPWWKLTAQKLHGDKVNWFQANERQHRDGMTSDQEESIVSWKQWLPDTTLSRCENEYLMVKECLEPICESVSTMTMIK